MSGWDVFFQKRTFFTGFFASIWSLTFNLWSSFIVCSWNSRQFAGWTGELLQDKALVLLLSFYRKF